MAKKISFGASPKNEANAKVIDDWVSAANEGANSKEAESNSVDVADKEDKGIDAVSSESVLNEIIETTRFTIDIPVDLHSRIKSYCALKRVKMREEIQGLLEKHFSAE